MGRIAYIVVCVTGAIIYLALGITPFLLCRYCYGLAQLAEYFLATALYGILQVAVLCAAERCKRFPCKPRRARAALLYVTAVLLIIMPDVLYINDVTYFNFALSIVAGMAFLLWVYRPHAISLVPGHE